MSNLRSPQVPERFPQALNHILYQRWKLVQKMIKTEEKCRGCLQGKLKTCFHLACNQKSTPWLLLSGCFLVLLQVLAQPILLHFRVYKH